MNDTQKMIPVKIHRVPAKPGIYLTPSQTRYERLATGQIVNIDKRRKKKRITVG